MRRIICCEGQGEHEVRVSVRERVGRRKEGEGELGKQSEGEGQLEGSGGVTSNVFVATRSMCRMSVLGVRHKGTDSFMRVYAGGGDDA